MSFAFLTPPQSRAARRSQPRYDHFLKPGLLSHPNSASPTRVWKWENFRPYSGNAFIVSVIDLFRRDPKYCLWNTGPLTASTEYSEDAQVPVRARAEHIRCEAVIPAVRLCAGVTEADGNECDPCFVVKGRTVQIHPISQAITTSIIPRDTSLMDLAAWRLADDQKPCVSRHA